MQRFGLVLVGIVLIACLWLGSLLFAAATPAVPADQESAPAGPTSTSSDSLNRIVYPPGQYPQLQSRDGAMHAVHSVLNVTHPLSFGEYVWDDSGVAPGPVWVRIDLSRQLLSVFRGGDESARR